MAEGELDRRWLWVVRVGAAVPLLLVVVAAFVELGFLLLGAPVLVGYGLILWGVRAKPLRAALWAAAAVGGLGAAVVGCLVVIILALSVPGTSGLGGVFALGLGFAATQVALAVGAAKLLPAVPWRPAEKRWVVGTAVGICLAAGLVAAVAIRSYLSSRTAAADANAADMMRTLNTAAVVYASTYENGFPPSLAALGPPPAGGEPNCDHADLIEATLTRGEKYGYRFEYKAGPPVEKRGEGCAVAGVWSYQIHARPIRYGETGTRSFYTDESVVTYSTTEDRAATAEDPPL